VLTHTYNGLDDRVATTEGTTTTRFVYDPAGRIVGEYGASASDVRAEHIWLSPEEEHGAFGGDDGTGGYTPLAVAQTPSGGTATLSWVHANHLGHPLLTTNATGTAITLADYTPLGFPGQVKTLPSLWYNRHRDYDPTTGRYIQADPIGLAGDANPYGYAKANPLKYIDPEGLKGKYTTRGRQVGGAFGGVVGGAVARSAGGVRVGQVIGGAAGAAVGSALDWCFDDDDQCKPIYNEIVREIEIIERRKREYAADASGLPEAGKNSRSGHSQTITQRINRLRKLVRQAVSKGCLNYDRRADRYV
jgi:RHS repeat-associated protein